MRYQAISVVLPVLVLFLAQWGLQTSTFAQQTTDNTASVETRLLISAYVDDLPTAPAEIRLVTATLPIGETIILRVPNGPLLLLVQSGNLTLLQADTPPLVLESGQQWYAAEERSIELRNENSEPTRLLIVSLQALPS